jgi:hypothetical protein
MPAAPMAARCSGFTESIMNALDLRLSPDTVAGAAPAFHRFPTIGMDSDHARLEGPAGVPPTRRVVTKRPLICPICVHRSSELYDWRLAEPSLVGRASDEDAEAARRWVVQALRIEPENGCSQSAPG